MMRLDVERIDGVPVARPSEDIDAANARLLRDELAGCLEGADRLVLDLGKTRYVDSAGIDMLLRLNELLRQRRTALLLVIPQSSQLTRLMQIVALPSVMAIHETVGEALGAVTPQSGA